MRVKISRWFAGCVYLAILFAFFYRPVIGFFCCWDWQAFFSPFYLFYWFFRLEWPYTESMSYGESFGEQLTGLTATVLGMVCVVLILVMTVVGMKALFAHAFKPEPDGESDVEEGVEEEDRCEDEEGDVEEEDRCEDEGPGGCRRGR